MNIRKHIITDYEFELELTNEKSEIFNICYAGGDLYWVMMDYVEGNEFFITKEDGMFFLQMEKLFNLIEKYDYPTNKTLNRGSFEWLSEAYGIPEEAHKLTITKNNDIFTIRFFQNPNHSFLTKSCPICFCLSGSKNPKIAGAFSLMFMQFKNYQNKEFARTLNKNI